MAGPVILGTHEQARGAERAAADLQIPAVVGAAEEHTRVAVPQPGDDTLEPRLRRLPRVTPDGSCPRAREDQAAEASLAAASPGREPLPCLAPQARQRVQQVQGGRQALKPQARRARA